MADQVDEVKQRADIVGVIGSGVELKKAGKYYKGLCPFHGEKSPSFFVSPEMQIFKCFGCGESGDVYSFLQKYEGLNFREALEFLAEKVGVKLESYRPNDQEEHTDRLYAILNLSQEYFHYLLTKHPVGQPACDYLESRKVPWTLVEKFYLGWAPDMWDGLYRYLTTKKGFTAQEIEKAGLVIKNPNRNSYYDRFRGRVIFPLRDFRGRVVGFSGRVLNPETKEAKYINTPETALYRKRELLFGVDIARSIIRKKDKVIIVEGEFDVISSVAAGVRHVVAIKGSAITEEHIRLLMRLTKQIILCLDADAAGDEAMWRGIDLADKMGLDVSVIKIAGGKDVDDLARLQPQKWKQLAEETTSIYQFMIDSIFQKYDQGSGSGKKKITQELVPVLNRISNKVEQAHYLNEVATRLGVAQEILAAELNMQLRKQQLGVHTATIEPVEVPVSSRREKLERYVWGLWLQLEGDSFINIKQAIKDLDWSIPGLTRLYHAIDQDPSQPFELKSFVTTLPSELQGLVQELYLDQSLAEVQREDQVLAELDRAIRDVKVLTHKARLTKLTQLIAQAEAKESLTETEASQLEQMQKEFIKLSAGIGE